ncbi:MAG: hypothetical protein DRP79_02810 [Planctomycetota bacterium]|nr:MAG: hypothetical protein DRP79_02810 [Planctomycetota bacterium]
MTVGRQVIRPEGAARPEGRLAEELSRGGGGAAPAVVAGVGALASLALVFVSPFCRSLGGWTLLVMLAAAGFFCLAALACAVIASVRLRRRQTPAKILSWIALPAAALMLGVMLVSTSRVLASVTADTRTDPEGRYSITRPGADWAFLAYPVTGENAEVEMVRTRGVPLHVIVRTGTCGTNSSALLYEIARLWMLPSMRRHHHHHHGGAAHGEKHARRYDIRSIEIILGDGTVARLGELFDEEVRENTRVLKRMRKRLQLLIDESAPDEEIAKVSAMIKKHEASLRMMRNAREGGALSLMVRHLASRQWPRDDPAYMAARRQTHPPVLDGVEGVKMLVRGRTAGGDEFVRLTLCAARNGSSYILECFAPAAAEAEAQAAFDRVIDGFRFTRES